MISVSYQLLRQLCSLLLFLLLNKCLPQKIPWLQRYEGAGNGGDAPHGGGLDISGLGTEFGAEELEESVTCCSWASHFCRRKP
ncbi:hypothetical protein FXO38_31654 [Capsicum annuum]|nr:hypothetical protein FXO38_31654 [Capsicum annuum]